MMQSCKGTVAVLVLWGILLGVGFTLLMRFDTTPGVQEPAPEQWPAASQLVRQTDQPTLLVFVHPHCVCSRATMHELDRIARLVHTPVAIRVLVVRPPEARAGWEQSEIWKLAAGIPGVTVSCDENGVEARRFGAETSGHVVLYHSNGTLLFRGGITPARGLEGDNAGRTTILHRLNDRSVECAGSPVFGCPLFSPCPLPEGSPCPK